MTDCRTTKYIVTNAAPHDYGPMIHETHHTFTEGAHDQRANVIAEAARRVAADNPRMDVQTIAQERGYLTGMICDQLAEMVLRARALARGRMGIVVGGGMAIGAAKFGPAVLKCML